MGRVKRISTTERLRLLDLYKKRERKYSVDKKSLVSYRLKICHVTVTHFILALRSVSCFYVYYRIRDALRYDANVRFRELKTHTALRANGKCKKREAKDRKRGRGMRATRLDHGRPILANAVVTVSLSSRLRERVGRRCVFNDHRNFLVRATLTRFPLPPSRRPMDHKSLNEGVKAAKGRRRQGETREGTGRVRHY